MIPLSRNKIGGGMVLMYGKTSRLKIQQNDAIF